MMGRPSAADFERMVRGNMLKHCPISVTDINNAHTISAPNIGSLRGKTVRKNINSDVGLCGNPRTDNRKMKTIELTVDVMFVNKISFVISLGKNMKITTIKNVVDQKAANLLKALHSIKVYRQIKMFL